MNFKDIKAQCLPAKLLAVSKLQPDEKIRALYNEGQRLFGENYVQEALDKMERLRDLSDIQWHLIGHLQKNKVKYIVGKFELIHSVDSLELAEMISRQCETKNVVEQALLIQVNVAGEQSKSGFTVANLKENWKKLTSLPYIKIAGLMTIPPLTENGDEVRPYFVELRELLQELRSLNENPKHSLSELSMGTSHDFQIAINEGATIVRLGTILFGERPTKR